MSHKRLNLKLGSQKVNAAVVTRQFRQPWLCGVMSLPHHYSVAPGGIFFVVAHLKKHSCSNCWNWYLLYKADFLVAQIVVSVTVCWSKFAYLQGNIFYPVGYGFCHVILKSYLKLL